MSIPNNAEVSYKWLALHSAWSPGLTISNSRVIKAAFRGGGVPQFRFVLTSHKISEPYDNSFWEKNNGPERKKEKKRS
jgi:hypothetical protein